MKLIDPLVDIGSDLCSIQNPSRYLGGEFGITVKAHDGNDDFFNFVIAFPDLYEIAMCNQAVKIIYNGLNQLQSVRCERVFAPDTDFEKLLRAKNIPLYSLETGMPLHEVDMIGFSIGYELGITGVLSILDMGRVPLLKKDRGENDPIVFAGGCGVTNPAAFSDFFDAVFIGEAENAMFDIVKEMAEMKKNGATRSEILKAFEKNPAVWTDHMSMESCGHVIAKRAVQENFGQVPSVPSYFPMCSVKPVQDHGVVEIMRGCPNGCRFCHAGIYYRPQRMKKPELVFQEVDNLVRKAGYRQISLTSLSSADYEGIGTILDELNKKYNNENVSFQLPSLKVNSISLPILDKLSEVRKSGLTFAVETPDEAWQLSLNKEVYAQHLIDIILQAKKRGWNKAKFYFMIGLPLGNNLNGSKNAGEPFSSKPLPDINSYVAGLPGSEEKAIVDFLLYLQEKTQIQCNVNVGTFIPKPHTPYQWIRQLSPEESVAKMDYIREHLPRGKFKVGTHNENVAFLEGLVSRCDRRAGEVILEAYKRGVRLDAWEEHLRENMPIWLDVFSKADWDVRNEILRERSLDEELPWKSVTLGPTVSFYKKEWNKSLTHLLTSKCSTSCVDRCGVCNKEKEVHSVKDDIEKILENPSAPVNKVNASHLENVPILWRCLFTFEKKDGSEYISHLSQLEIFQRAFLCASLPILYTNGFNPIPRLEFASTLSIGIRSYDEIASCVLTSKLTEDVFIEKMNACLPSNLRIKSCYIFEVTNQRKRESLATSLWGNRYDYSLEAGYDMDAFLSSEMAREITSKEGFICNKKESSWDFTIPFKYDRPFRNAMEEFFGKKIYEFCHITKTCTLASPVITGWTAEDDKAWLASHSKADMSDVICDEVSKETKDNTPVPYYELYERIAQINQSLIQERRAIAVKRREFFKAHPEMANRNKTQKPQTKKDDC